MNCVFTITDCCNIPSYARTVAIDKIVFILSDKSADEICADSKFWKAGVINPLFNFYHFSIGTDGSITKFLDLNQETYNSYTTTGAIYINIETPTSDSCTTFNFSSIYDSLFRVVCCIHKELVRLTPLRFITGDFFDPNRDLEYLALKTITRKILDNLSTDCLLLAEAPAPSGCDNDDLTDCCSDCGSSNSCTGCGSCSNCISCACIESNTISTIKADFINLKNSFADLTNVVHGYQAFINTQVSQINYLNQTVTAFQEFYGTHLACLRRLCVLDGCFDCKVHYSIFKPQVIYAGVDTPINFDIKVTDNDPSYVTNNGYFRYCPPEAGNYKVEIHDIMLPPAKYCAGDKVQIISSLSGIVYTYTVVLDSNSLVVQLPNIDIVEPLAGGCLSYSILITSKDFIQRMLVNGNIVIYKII